MKFPSNLSEETILFSELTVRDYKELLKCILGDEPNELIFVETVSEIFSNITKKPISYFRELSALDFLLLLIDLKIYTSGNKCSINVKRNGKNANLDLNLAVLQRDLLKEFKPFNSIISCGALEVKFECPSVNRLLEKNKTDEDYLWFIKSACINQSNNITIKTNEQSSMLFNKLMPKFSTEILQKYKKFVDTCTSTNFLSRYKITESVLNFLPTIENVIWFSKLFFNEPLDVFYNNLFYLSYYGHMNLTHIEQCTVGEYIYYVNMLNSVQSSKQKQEDTPNQTIGEFPVDTN